MMTKDYNLLLEAAHTIHDAPAQKTLIEGSSANHSGWKHSTYTFKLQ